MRIKSIQLKDYKRFVDLTITDIPETVRLVTLVGPNGSGKSSLFDAFLFKSWSSKTNQSTSGNNQRYRGYYSRSGSDPRTTSGIAQRVSIEFHSKTALTPDGWAGAFNVRSAYRNEADFRLQAIQPVQSAHESPRFPRIIDADEAVSDNYGRLAWKRQADIDRNVPDDMTMGEYRREFLSDLQVAMRQLFTDPTLSLQDFGGVQNAGAFRFSKGTANDFHYKNLSGGEKAAFDLILDIFVKREEYQDAIYCIDEPEAHVAAALHGPLLKALLDLVPEYSQLWIATHSAGFVRQANKLMRQKGDGVFLNFADRDFDQPVVIRPQVLNRTFWENTYRVALDDLADLVAPESIVICEGKKSQADGGFDATSYNRLFAETHPETLFISYGSASEVENSQNLVSVLKAVAKGSTVWSVIDRDDMTDEERTASIEDGVRVLRRRELENYLYDPEVLRTFLSDNNMDALQETILEKRQELLDCSPKPGDMKSVTQQLLNYIRAQTRITTLGRSREAFALSHLVPALRETPSVFHELMEDVFPQSSAVVS